MPDILEIGAKVDLSDLTAKMEGGARSVEQSTGRMAQSFTGVAAATRTAAERAAAAGADFTNFGAKGIFAFENLQHRMIEALRTLSELRAEMLAATSDAERAKLAPDLSRAQAQYTALRTELRGLRLETLESTEKLNLLANAFGVRVPAEMERMLARIPGVQNAMYRLFEVSLIVGMIAALGELVKKVGEYGEKLYEESERSRTAWTKLATDVATENANLDKSYRELGDRIAAIGAGPLAGYQAKLAAVAAEHSRLGGEISRTSGEMAKELAVEAPWYESLVRLGGGIVYLTSYLNPFADRVKLAKDITQTLGDTFRGVGDDAENFAAKLNLVLATEGSAAGVTELAKKQAELVKAMEAEPNNAALQRYFVWVSSQLALLTKEERNQLREGDQIRAEAAEKRIELAADAAKRESDIFEASSKAQVAMAHYAYAEGRISAEQWMQAEISADQAVFADKESYYARVESLFRRNPEKEAQLKAEQIKFEQEGLARAYEDTARSITQFDTELLRSINASHGEVEAIRDLHGQLQAVVADTGKFTVDLHVSPEQQETIARLTKATLDWVKANQELHSSQLAMQAVEISGGYEAQIELVRRSAAEGVISQRQAAAQTIAIYRAQKDYVLASMGEQLDAQEAMVEAAQARMVAAIGSGDAVRIAQARASLAQEQAAWVTTQTGILHTTQEYNAKIASSTDQMLREQTRRYQEFFQSIKGGLDSGIAGMVHGTETLRHAWVSMVLDMETKFLQSIANQLVGFLQKEVIKLVVARSTEQAMTAQVALGQEAQTAAVAAGQTAQTTAATTGAAGRADAGLIADIKSIGHAAATAAAHAFKWVMVEVPFPLNAILAPAAAAAAFAGVMAFSAFAEGGPVKAQGLVSGPGSGTSDSIPARLSHGEYVVRAAAVQKLGVPLLDNLNRGYAAGGLVGSAGDVATVGDAGGTGIGGATESQSTAKLGEQRNQTHILEKIEYNTYRALIQHALSSVPVIGSIAALFAQTGGHVVGPGSGTSDSIPAMLSNGEYVLRAEMVRQIGVSKLDVLNRGGVPHFAGGGWVMASTATATTVPRFDIGGVVGAASLRGHGLALPAPILSGGRGDTHNDLTLNVYHNGQRTAPDADARRMFDALAREFRRRNFSI